MAFYINVRKEADDNYNITYKFIQHNISLGADISNNLRLIDREKSVSPIHAEIHFNKGKYHLLDRGSVNGTYVKDSKLVPDFPYLIEDGMGFKIGDYLLTFWLHKKKENIESSDKKNIINEITHLADILEYLNILSNGYFTQRGDKELLEMLEGIFTGRDFKKLGCLMGKIIHKHKDISEERANKKNIDFVLNLFFNMFIELFEISAQITNEFIGLHTVHRRDSKQIISLNQLKKYILDSKLSREEWENRKDFLVSEIQDVITRQTALYAGYRNSIKYGTRDLLKTLDPQIIKKNILHESLKCGPVKIQQKYFPILIYRRAFKTLICIYKSLTKQSCAQIADKYFRPAFISGYLHSIKSNQVNSEKINNIKV